VIGYATGELPAFYAATAGLPLSHRVDDPAGAAAVIAAHRGVPGSGGLLFVQPPPSDVALDGQEVEAWISAALRDAVAVGVRGAAVTPHVLAHIARASGGRALRANVALIVNNAATAGRIAVALVSHRS
jgi:pseudouridine-5'-phosphate glycosidase